LARQTANFIDNWSAKLHFIDDWTPKVHLTGVQS
jgi:hypothetical protein